MLKEKIIKLINQNGAIPFDKFMNICLTDKDFGYYINSEAVGANSDFITAPEISQVFGELIGLWLLDSWYKLGCPKRCHLIELGAGRGTLLSDILRATKKVVNFHEAIDIQIVEINPTLKNIQKDILQGFNIRWVDSVEQLDIDSPMLIYSNEFFDVLPVKQYHYKDNKFFELMILSDYQNKSLSFGFVETLNPVLSDSAKEALINKGDGGIYETSPIANSIFLYLTSLIKSYGGILLTIDYGYYNLLPFANSIRGFKDHKLLDIFEIVNQVGQVDFTYNVNFKELYQVVEKLNIDTYEIITQKYFLDNLGLQERVKKLLSNIDDPSIKESFLARINYLVSDDEMGCKFKVMLVSSKVSDLAVFKTITKYKKLLNHQ